MKAITYKDIDMSFKKDFKSDIKKKVDVDAINQHLKLLLLTEENEIPFMNNVSSDLRNLLFQPFSPLIKNTIEILVENIIKQFEQRIRLNHVIVTNNKNEIIIDLIYVIKQTELIGKFQTILKRTR